jgi:2,6-dihydroxypyridine 3-monooxygenase
MRIAVVGGSLGGLTAALLLRDLGHDVTIYERSPVPLEQRGAGIGLLTETSRYFTECLDVDLDTMSITTKHIRHLDRTGSIIHDHLHTYRFSSWNTIYRGLMKAFGTDRYLLDHEVDSIEQSKNTPTLQLQNGETIDADLVVCADGVASRFRRHLLPAFVQNYAGYVAWRGMVPEHELPPHITNALGDALTYSVIANSHILVYPIPGIDGSVEPGKRLINYVWYRNYFAGTDLTDVLTGNDGVTREVSLPPGLARADHIAEVKAHATARLPGVISTVVDATEQPFLQVVFDADVEQMVFGRVCLLGDAAWVARPHAAAGTAKAADDAWALADELRAHSNVDDALRSWEARQMTVGRELVDRTRRIGAQSQFDGTWRPDDPEHIFGLKGPGK